MIIATPQSGRKRIAVKKNTPVIITLTGGKGFAIEVQHTGSDRTADYYAISQIRIGEAKRLQKLKEKGDLK